QTFKFCNAFRAADRVSQYLIREVAYHDEGCAPEDRFFQVVAFRLFSKISTWETVREYLRRHPTLRDLVDGSFAKALEFARHKNRRLYTGAFILCAANPYDQPSKHLNHVELLRHMCIKDKLPGQVM